MTARIKASQRKANTHPVRPFGEMVLRRERLAANAIVPNMVMRCAWRDIGAIPVLRQTLRCAL